MKRPNKTMRRKQQRRQRSRRHSYRYRKHTRRYKHRGGSLPVPAGSVVAISTAGEYGVPVLMSKEEAEAQQERGSLEE